MNRIDYENRIKDLFERWKCARPEYSTDGKCFTHDGIINFERWNNSKPKILFLLKENYDPDWEPIDGITVDGKTFSRNIALWRQIIIELYENPEINLSFSDVKLPPGIDDIAIMEVKKLNEGFSSSSYRDILLFASKDKDFLQEQIELINPQVILCGYTCDAYGDYIYDDSWERLNNIEGPIKCNCYNHLNRLVIDFYHPSSRYSSLDLFELLYKLLKEGNVFAKFDWRSME